MKKYILLILLTYLHISVVAQKPQCQGLLWEITGNGLEQPSYLYGTMHVSNKVAFHLSDSFYKAIASVDAVALEINPETWMETMTTDDFVADGMGNVFSMRSNNRSAGFYKAVFQKEQPENKDIGAALGAELGILNSLLYRTSNYSADFQEDTYLDLFIYQAGKKQGKMITGLEKLGATMRLNEEIAKPEGDKKRKKEIKEAAERYRHELSKILDNKPYGEVIENAYRLGDLDLLDSMSRLAGSQKSHDLIIVFRNIGMADAMDSIMRTQSLFAGVGAAHLANNYGVINLLREKGYTVRAVGSAKSDYGTKVKDKLEETFITQKFNAVTSYDGVFSTQMPGKLYEFPEAGGVRMAAYPDMANGAKYVVTRINTFGALYGVNPSQFLDKLDSLFFENIPGKILEKNRIEIDGVPGFDIKNKMKKGDVQRYHVMVTPLEIIIFKAAGKKEFVYRTEVNQFFDNLHFHKKEGTTQFSPLNNAYSVLLPGTPSYEAENNAFLRGYWQKTVQSYDEPAEYFAVMNQSYNDMEYMEEDSFELSQVTRFYTKQFGYTLTEFKHDSTHGYASFWAKSTADGKSDLYTKAILVGSQYYMLTAQTTSLEKANEFLNSIAFLPYEFARPFKMQHDTARLFSVMSSVRPPAQVQSYYNYYSDDSEEDESHLDETKMATYYSKESDETIYVRMYKYHKYFYTEAVDSIWSLYRKQIRQNTFFVRSEKIEDSNGNQSIEIEVGDTNTNRNVLVKHILKDGIMYSLFTETNYRLPRSQFVGQFFESFTPWDTTVGTPILQNKVDMFLTDLVSEDSITREAAYNSYGVITFEDEDAPKLIKAYEHMHGRTHDLENRVNLLEALGDLNHSSILPFLVKEAKEVQDSVQFQLPILRAIAHQKNKKSTKAFAQLIVDETPLTEYSQAIEEMFYPFGDSLEVAGDLYPEILLLTALPEYKEPVYSLLAALKDSNEIKSRDYKKHLKKMAWEANNEVKRQKGAESDQTKDFYKEESRQTLYSYDDLLKYYASLLHPFHSKAKAKKFFERADQLNSPGFKIDLAIIRLKGGEELPTEYWEQLASNENDRIVLYQRLKGIDRLDVFPSQYGYDELVKGLFAQKTRINQYKDSLVFVTKQWVTTAQDSGYMYFFKAKEKNEDWVFGYIGLIDTTLSTLNRYGYSFEEDMNFNKYEDEAQQIALEIRKMEMADRPRYRAVDEEQFKELKSKTRNYRYSGY